MVSLWQSTTYVEISVFKADYSTDSRYYWDEISHKLTDSDRWKIASKYMETSVENITDIEEGIRRFLNHVVLDISPIAGKVDYPYNKHLLVVDSVNEQRYYLLFSDYTLSFCELLNKEFGIKIRQKKIKALYNIYDYNDLLPIGTDDDCKYVMQLLKPILSKYDSQIALEPDENEKRRLLKKYNIFKNSLLTLQFALENNRFIKGYGKKCPFTKSSSALEKTSLQTFIYPVFGFHIGITLLASREVMEYITQYSNEVRVSIINSFERRKKTREGNNKILFSCSKDIYLYENKEWDFSEIDKNTDKGVVINVVKYIRTLLQDINNNLFFEIKSVSEKGEVKEYNSIINLTIPHRVLMICELDKAINNLTKLIFYIHIILPPSNSFPKNQH